MNIKRKLLISFSGPFGEKEIAPLNNLDRVNVARSICILNHKARIGKLASISDFFDFWFGGKTPEAYEVFNPIRDYYQKSGYSSKQVAILNLWSNLTLMNLLLAQQPNEEFEKGKGDFNTLLLHHYLKVNEKFALDSDNLAKEIRFEDYERREDYIARVLLSNGINNFDIAYTNDLHNLIANFYKSYQLLSFLDSEYNELLNVFLTDYNVPNKEHFLKAILPVAFHAMNGAFTDSGIQILKTDNESSRDFLDRLISNSENCVDSSVDFSHLRANPLFKMDDNEYLIIDRGLAINRLFASIFFDVHKIIKDKRIKINGDFFFIYTYGFIEKYLTYTVLDKIYKKRGYKVLSGEDIVRNHNVDTEPDYYVRNGKKILLFEIKASIIRGEVKQSFSWTEIEKELKKKFYGTPKEKKAVLQLIERIEILVNKEDKRGVYDSTRPNNFIVTPILLVTDHALNTLGVNHILNAWFTDEVNKSEILSPIKHRIRKLVIVNIDTLIVYSEYLKDKSGAFEDFLGTYIDRIDASRIDSIKNKRFENEAIMLKELEQRINDTLVPFSKHLEESLEKPKMIKEFIGFAEKLF